MLNLSAELDHLFHALADPARRAMIERLSHGPAPVSELARPLPMSLPAAMQHLAVLEAAGLVRSEKIGRVRTCAIEPQVLSLAEQWINARRIEWEHRLDRLGDYLKSLESKETTMAQPREANHDTAAQRLEPLRLSRVFHARRETVFRAWSSAEHIKRWFCPETFTIPDANVQMHVGGLFEVCMRSPAGEEHWIRGRFVEVLPQTRLVIEMRITDSDGKPLFDAHTAVDFSDAPGGTQLDLVQSYTLIDPTKAWMMQGAPEGWSTTLDKLEKEVLRMQGAAETGTRSVVHARFHLHRSYDAPVARVWRALTDPAAKRAWFSGPPDRWTMLERHMDVRVGGTERLKGRWEGGVVSTFDAVYHDVIPNERLVYSYVMHLDDKKISVSLATIQLQAETATRTILRVSEQGAFLDGYDDAGSREQGTGFLLDALEASLRE
jgi:uncharacterized protein YndB with AHSA1/START domain/DNA-binding transcriptional ArsR family regulator